MKIKYTFTFFGLFCIGNALAQNTFPNDGNVGIGTLSPTAWFGGKTLQIEGNRPVLRLAPATEGGIGTILLKGKYSDGVIGSEDEFHINYVSNYSNPYIMIGGYKNGPKTIMTIMSSGNVGVGTETPQSKFEVQTAGSGWLINSRSSSPNPGDINGLKFYSGYLGDDKWAGIASVAEDLHSNKTGLSFYSGQIEKMRLSWNGNLGLGTLNPSAKIDVSLGAGTSDGTVGIKIGSISDYPSLELGVENNYDAQIRTFGNDLNIYAGHFRNIGNTSTEDHKINFYTSKNGSTNWNLAKMVLTAEGRLGIGTTAPNEKLTVAGKISAQEIKVSTNAGADFVFEPGYKLPGLLSLEKFVKVNKHLPEIPTAKQMVANGVELGELNIKLLQKVEELTLHLIEKDKQITSQSILLKAFGERLLKLEKGNKKTK